MEELFTPRYQWLWTLVLGGALFVPVRQLIWVASVRRQQRKTGQPADDVLRQSLKRRANITSLLLCIVFSVLYVQVIFSKLYGAP